MSTLFATFSDAAMAQRAVGALLDHGADKDSISLVANETHEELWKAESHAKTGVTTTSGADAAHGAAKGAGIGLGLGILGGLASLFIPGFGLVLGGSAMATALAAAAGTTAAGAFTGAVEGYLVDQGVPQAVATSYKEALAHGSALLSIALPSGKLDRVDAENVVAKYNGSQTFYR
jgi:hypothetical protein